MKNFGRKSDWFLWLSLSMILVSTAFAETVDFGGYPDRFKGAGDKIPPQCQIDIPNAADSAFSISWNCEDDNAPRENIKTELWMYTAHTPASQLVGSFLGFPAAVKVDETLLKSASVVAGLPASFRLHARDTAGNSATSVLFTVRVQDNGLKVCNLTLNRSATQSTSTTTGTPATSVVVDKAKVSVDQSQGNTISIATKSTTEAEPCTIDEVCEDTNEVSFTSMLTLSSANGGSSASTVSGTVTVTPGSVSSTVSGTATYNDLVLSSVSVSGELEIDGVASTLSLTCSN